MDKVLFHYSMNVFMIVRTVGTRKKDDKNTIWYEIFDTIWLSEIIFHGLNALNFCLTEVKKRILTDKSHTVNIIYK